MPINKGILLMYKGYGIILDIKSKYAMIVLAGSPEEGEIVTPNFFRFDRIKRSLSLLSDQESHNIERPSVQTLGRLLLLPNS